MKRAGYLVLAGLFGLLILWECRTGVVAGRNGGAAFSTFPGVAGFILALQIGFAGWLAGQALGLFRGPSKGLLIATAGFGAVLAALGAWAVVDLLVALVRMVAEMKDDLASALGLAMLLLVGIGVFCTLLSTMVLIPIGRRVLAQWRLRKDR